MRGMADYAVIRIARWRGHGAERGRWAAADARCMPGCTPSSQLRCSITAKKVRRAHGVTLACKHARVF